MRSRGAKRRSGCWQRNDGPRWYGNDRSRVSYRLRQSQMMGVPQVGQKLSVCLLSGDWQ
jgi:hypothetical protein